MHIICLVFMLNYFLKLKKPFLLGKQRSLIAICVVFFLLMIQLMQADLEEAKTQENAKLKSALQEMQQQFEETKTLLIKEREAAKKTTEALLIMEREAAEKEAVQVPVIREVPVIDHVMVNKLTAENEELKVGSQLWFF